VPRAQRARVPQVTGHDLATAYSRLHAAGLRVSYPNAFSDGGLSECLPTVKTEEPAAGKTVRVGATVSLSPFPVRCGVGSPAVPVGPLPSAVVPSFAGQTILAASRWAENHQLLWEADKIPPLHSGDAPQLLSNYTVSHQHPEAGATLTLGIGHSCCNGNGGSFLPTPLTLTGTQINDQ
jgi:hypothetical protein